MSRAPALSYLWNQGENGICCPILMTFALDPGAAARSGPAGGVGAADPTGRPTIRATIYAKQKTGVTVGMAMTEKQGGSDLRAR